MLFRSLGNNLVEQAGRTMEEVVASVRRVARIMADISAASREQSAGIEQIYLAVNQMDEVTQQNAALVEEAAAAAESLEEQAIGLARVVSIFHVADVATGVRPFATPRSGQQAAGKVAAAAERRPGGRKQPQLAASLDDEWEEF